MEKKNKEEKHVQKPNALSVAFSLRVEIWDVEGCFGKRRTDEFL